MRMYATEKSLELALLRVVSRLELGPRKIEILYDVALS